MSNIIRILVCFVFIFLITMTAIPGEISSLNYHKIDPRLAIMLENPEMKSLVYTQMTGRQLFKNITRLNVLMKTELDQSAFEKFSVKVQAKIGDIVTATVPIEQIATLVNHPRIFYIQSPSTASIHCDVSMPEIGAIETRNQYNLSGKGVIVGIIDTGIDWRHLDFRKSDGSTRIIALLDFSDPGDFDGDGELDGPDQYGGTLYTEQEINNALNGIGTVNEKDLVGHGTHVAGIAAGNGRATGKGVPAETYVGVAPEADLIIVKGTRELGGFNFESTDYINAIAFIDSIADALNKPYVVNLSFGGSQGPHDGQDLSEQAIDNLLAGAYNQGKAVVVSAGNEADKNIHASGTFGSGITEIETIFTVPPYTAKPENIDDYIVFEGWYKATLNYSVKIVTPGGKNYGPISSEREGGFQTDEGTIYISNAKGGPSNLNGDKQILIQIYDFEAAKPPKEGDWKIVVAGSSGRFDLWLSGSSIDDVAITSNIDPSMILGTPGTAFYVITVGSYITKKQWIDLDGKSVGFQGLVLGDASSFSSPGPTRDGRTKPEVAAPGELIASSYSVDAPPSGEYSIFNSGNSDIPNGYICQDGKHAVTMGTSFAAPHISGVIALMLQKSPQLPSSQIKAALIASTRTDKYTLTVPNNKWGYGKVDALAATQYITGQLPEKKLTVSIFQNPAITQYIDFYLISKYALEGTPTTTIQIGGSTPENITMTAIESNIYKGDYQFAVDGTATLKIIATIQGEPSATLTEYFGVKLLKANSGGMIGFDKVNLSVPPNNHSLDTYFTIIPNEQNSVSDKLLVIGPAYQIGPIKYAFTQSAALTFSYDDEDLANLDELKLGIYVFEYGYWKRLNSSIDKKNNIVAATIDRLGIFRLCYDPNNEITSNLPIEFNLCQNYPNPFNTNTTIEYEIPYDAQISIKIFNLEGKLVMTLFDGVQRAGYHKTIWDGQNGNKQPAASGLYVCQFISEKFSMTRKMLLLK